MKKGEYSKAITQFYSAVCKSEYTLRNKIRKSMIHCLVNLVFIGEKYLITFRNVTKKHKCI